MKSVIDLERAGYRLNLAIDYTAPERIPQEAEALLSELAAHKPEAILYLAERVNYPEHTRTSEQYRSAITKGIQAGASPYELLLQAVKCISDMTGDQLFYTQNRENIKAIRGAGLLEPIPLEMELAEVRRRLTMLTRPELDTEPEDSRARIKRAVKAHREREAHILNMLGKANDRTTD